MSKYKEQSEHTKELLSQALKKMMTKKSLQKISVNDIVKECNLNRNSFYYHFDDVYDLLKFTFEKDAVNIIRETDLNTDMKNAISFVADYIDKNKKFCLCAYNSLGRDQLKLFFKKDFHLIISNYITDILNNNNLSINEDLKNYIVFIHIELMVSHLIYYLKDDFKIEKDKLFNYMIIIFNNSIKSTIKLIENNEL